MAEIKFDGYRALVACAGGKVRVFTRNGHDWTDKFARPVPASTIRISHRDRIIFPGTGETKGDLADYYAAVAPLMLPFAAGAADQPRALPGRAIHPVL